MFYLFGKRVFLVGILVFTCAGYSFGEFIWSTVGGSRGRIIPMNTVKIETMKIYDQFNWGTFCWDSEGHFMDRTTLNLVTISFASIISK